MKLHNISSSLDSVKAETLVLFATQKDKKLNLDCSHKKDLGPHLDKLSGRFSGKAKESVFLYHADVLGFSNLLLVGLGAANKVTEESLRIAFAGVSKALKKEKASSAAICLETIRKLTKSAEGAGQAVAEGLLLGEYKFDTFRFKKKDAEPAPEIKDMYLVLKDKTASKKFGVGVQTGTTVAECVNFARDLENYPSNHLTPTILAEKAKEACKGTSIACKVFNKAQIEKLGMGSFLAVAQGSIEEPRFIVMEYFGAGKAKPPVVLVGKGVTFDTGGISIKPAPAMEEMKFDMSGAATVIAATVAAAKLKLKTNIVTLVPATENMPSGSAIKPGDIAKAMNGKFIEINNTDAEGRLILCDALTYGTTEYKPKAILDVATLTGACAIALGNVFSGVFSRDEKLMKTIFDSANATGENLWRLPLTDEYIDDMKGVYADLTNISATKGGGASHGAAFLSYFVENDVPWAHFDIAGTAWHTGNRKGYSPDKGGSGVLVRLLVNLAGRLA